MCQTLIRCTWWRSLAVVICRARETWCDRRLEETKEGSTVIVEAMFVYVAVESQLLRVGCDDFPAQVEGEALVFTMVSSVVCLARLRIR